MKINGTVFRQAGVHLAVGCVKASELADLVERGIWAPDVFRASHPEGYQRELTEARAREFARFVRMNGVSPLPILLNFREGRVAGDDGTLDLPDSRGYIVDGQHRAHGIRLAVAEDPSIGDYDVPIVVMCEPDAFQEARQFVIINRTQKGINPSLAEEHLLQSAKTEGRRALLDMQRVGVLKAVVRGAEWKTKAIEIANSLNDDDTSPWYGLIRQPNEPKDETVINKKSFTDSLEPILKDVYFQGKESHVIASALRNYWNAINDLCDEAFLDPAGHVLQKTTGVFVLHKVFPRIAEFATDESGRRVLTRDNLRTILEKPTLPGVGPVIASPFWSSGGHAGMRGTGKKAFGILAMEILEAIETSISGSRGAELLL
ncbi:DGQHR domain-containing protein [Fimbriimonadia bacterium ATM]|nr:MAG: DGQHR domain-containing protein [Armatimonadota bacterium]MBC6970589.1 DGQHR domain-containing protein [Armatimonadota bacterium]MCE7899454.1 DGQHR domain-containing protein [Armatimonadetes bacterium ATM1]MDL1929195.1 DGQHR domain-containing protein [Fimbriimonadia bacterium ATM]RIJ96523.1 MAG: hypothetical protein DCC45_07675 [Armatimonadota bacterium]